MRARSWAGALVAAAVLCLVIDPIDVCAWSLQDFFGPSAPQDAETDAAVKVGEHQISQGQRVAEDLLRSTMNEFAPQASDIASLGITVGEFDSALAAIDADPYYDFRSSCQYSYYNDADELSGCTLTGFTIDYLIPEEARATYAAVMSAALDEAVASLDSAASAYDKVLALHDWLVRRCAFDGGASTAHTAYGALVQGAAGNRGYADAFFLLLDRAGIESRVVSSQAGVSWNMVLVDGAWYHVDVAWDDPTPDAGADAEVSHRFFLRGDEFMAGTHDAWEAGQRAPRDYAALMIGETSADRVAYARTMWLQALDALAPEVTGLEMYGITVEEAYAAFDQVVADPYYDYVDTHGVTYLNDADEASSCTVSRIYATYRIAPEQFVGYREEMDAAIAEALSGAQGLGSDYERIRAVHDWLVRNCVYTQEDDDIVAHTSYGALVRRDAVCQGYTGAFKLLLARLGIPCEVVVSEAMDHQWNMVFLDGAWYHVDVTWDDPVPDQGYDAPISYDNFLRGDDGIRSTGHYGWQTDLAAPADYQSWWL